MRAQTMAFQFPLATVLRFRKSLERREELALQRVLIEVAQHKRKIEQLSAKIAEAEKMREERLRQPIPAFQLQSMLSEIQVATDRRRSLIETLAALEQKRIKQMADYQAALGNRKILSDLEQRQREAYELKRTRAQQKRIDDIFGARAYRG
jgi:flagellar export protein FliJ